ncbi:MAG: 3-hydroxyacyl-ACP dehydratase [Anaerolineae bacterium]|nr:3-hydroxyacyl-ACP dehydratase [Anaerolineae bacterium]
MVNRQSFAGLDIGSRTIALVEWDGERVTRAEVVDTGIDPVGNARRLMAGRVYRRLVATGYGRNLAAERELADEVISEIKAYGLGAYHLYPDTGTVLDIGGQDSKAIRVGPDGRVTRFEMNDRCAAGTGRFLENMARALGMDVSEFGPHALEANGSAVRVSSMCTVFAESEVVSLIARGEDSRRIALGLHQAIVDRVGSMVRRVGVVERVVFAGGVALNPCLHQLFSAAFGVAVTIPDDPQTVGALGAALHAAYSSMQEGSSNAHLGRRGGA